jgi:hypothetical protein
MSDQRLPFPLATNNGFRTWPWHENDTEASWTTLATGMRFIDTSLSESSADGDYVLETRRGSNEPLSSRFRHGWKASERVSGTGTVK